MGNVVYESQAMTVVDGREFLSIEQAIGILLAGGAVDLCDPPDYGAENEFEIFSHPFRVCLLDCLSGESWEGWAAGRLAEGVVRAELSGYLRGYEISA